jgi:hypothetical protein
MITAILIGLLALVSCVAAAGLIASTQNSTDEARVMADLNVDPNAGV